MAVVSIAMAAASVVAAVAAFASIRASRQLQQKKQPGQVFFIYAREDLERAQGLAYELRQHGLVPWLDVNELRPGESWQKATLEALEESSVALFLMSAHTKKHGFVQKELQVALSTLLQNVEGISPVVPVRLEPQARVPENLAHLQWVDLTTGSGKARLIQQLVAVTKGTEQVAPPDPSPSVRGG